MVLRVLSGGAIAALAGVTMLALSNCPSSAFTLASPSLEHSVAAASIDPVDRLIGTTGVGTIGVGTCWHHWGWHHWHHWY